jgi:hypothetical protein
MFWGKGKDPEDVPRERKEERPASLSEPLPREKLNENLQKIVDKEDTWLEQVYEGG